ASSCSLHSEITMTSCFSSLFLTDTPPPALYTLSLHDALPICSLRAVVEAVRPGVTTRELDRIAEDRIRALGGEPSFLGYRGNDRSEEHTSELQSRGHLVCRLLLEKKKKQKKNLMCSNNTNVAL